MEKGVETPRRFWKAEPRLIHRMNVRVIALLALGGWVTTVPAADSPDLKDPKQKLSYSIGMSLGGNFKRQSVDIDPQTLMRGVQDALAGKTLLTETDATEAIMTFRREQSAKLQAERKEQGEKAKKEGAAFLAANKSRDGVVALPSGLQYKIVTPGNGASPKTNDTVVVHYRGTLVNGTEFDGSEKHGGSSTLNLGHVMAAWREALPLMKTGAKWQLFVPPNLAYGERGYGSIIPPDSTLIFEVELLSIKPAVNESITSDIIKVPSAAELKAGAKPEIIKASDLDKLKAAEKAGTNHP